MRRCRSPTRKPAPYSVRELPGSGRGRRTRSTAVPGGRYFAIRHSTAWRAAQGQLASDYMQLRIADELKRLLDAATTAYAESLRISQNQYNAGIVSASDVAQARTQLENTRAQAIATGVQRAQFEHAIA